MTTRSFAALLVVVLLTTGCALRDQSDARREQDSSLPRVVRIREGKVIFWLKPDAVEAAKGLGRNLDDVVAGAASPVVETLRSPETDVYIDANPEWTIEGIGVGGRTHPSTGRVVINIDPGFDDPDSLFDIWLPRTIAHELHHSKRINDGPGYGKTIEQAVVTEA
jgi:hypothetical protein